MLLIGLRRVWPINLHRVCRFSCSTGIWHVRCHHNRSLLMILSHQTPMILLGQLLTNGCITFVIIYDELILHLVCFGCSSYTVLHNTNTTANNGRTSALMFRPYVSAMKVLHFIPFAFGSMRKLKEPLTISCLISKRCYRLIFLPLDETIATRAVIIVLSGRTGGRTGGTSFWTSYITKNGKR